MNFRLQFPVRFQHRGQSEFSSRNLLSLLVKLGLQPHGGFEIRVGETFRFFRASRHFGNFQKRGGKLNVEVVAHFAKPNDFRFRVLNFRLQCLVRFQHRGQSEFSGRNLLSLLVKLGLQRRKGDLQTVPFDCQTLHNSIAFIGHLPFHVEHFGQRRQVFRQFFDSTIAISELRAQRFNLQRFLLEVLLNPFPVIPSLQQRCFKTRDPFIQRGKRQGEPIDLGVSRYDLGSQRRDGVGSFRQGAFQLENCLVQSIQLIVFRQQRLLLSRSPFLCAREPQLQIGGAGVQV